MFASAPLSHTLIAAGLIVGLTATSTLTVSAAPAAAAAVVAAGKAADAVSSQELVVGPDGELGVFGAVRDVSQVVNAPLVVWPVHPGSPVSDGFGHREAPTEGASTEHPGLDFAAAAGAAVRAAATGVVRSVQSTDDGGCGVHIAVAHVVLGQPVTTVYCHLTEGSVRVRAGQEVVVGEVIGAVGNTGVSTGAHLHFEVRPGNGAPIDPLAWLDGLAA